MVCWVQVLAFLFEVKLFRSLILPFVGSRHVEINVSIMKICLVIDK